MCDTGVMFNGNEIAYGDGSIVQMPEKLDEGLIYTVRQVRPDNELDIFGHWVQDYVKRTGDDISFHREGESGLGFLSIADDKKVNERFFHTLHDREKGLAKSPVITLYQNGGNLIN